MPGKLRKIPSGVGAMRKGFSKPATPGRPAARPVISGIAKTLNKPAIPGGGLRRNTNMQRVVGRTLRREAVRQTVNQSHSLPRPAARPVAPPLKMMPKVPAPPRLGVVRPQPAAIPGTGSLKARPKPGADRVQQPAGRAVTVGDGLTGLAALSALAINLASAHPSVAQDASALQYSLQRLQSDGSLEDIETDIASLDSNLNHVLDLLESARAKGYAFQKDLEEIAYQAAAQWQGMREQVLNALKGQSAVLSNRFTPLGGQVQTVNRLLGNPAAAGQQIRVAHNQVNELLVDVGRIRSDLEGTYAEIESQVYQLTNRLTQIHWALDQIQQARFQLEKTEDLVMAVGARWDQSGKDDPEGILYITDQRLIFERKEKVATKKVLFLTMASELVQELLIDQPIANLKDVKAANKGVFGHQDFLEVLFSEPKLGQVSLHLNGQDSEHWSGLINSVLSGAIEQDRAAGSGISIQDLTRPLTSADLVAMQAEMNELQDEVLLTDVRSELDTLESEVRDLSSKLAAVRARGYMIEKTLEVDVQLLAAQWDRIRDNADSVLKQQSGLLNAQMQELTVNLGKLMSQSSNLAAARPLYMQVKSAMASLEAQADAAEDVVLTQFDEYDDEVDALSAHLEWVGWMLDALSTASFRLLATESGVAAAEAIWERTGLEPESGILFLTDQRLLWEDRVETFELKFDLPLQLILDVKMEPRGEQQVLEFSLDAGAPTAKADFLLTLPVGDAWIKMIGRARAGDYLKDRSVELSEDELARVRNAPQQCSNCGAAFTAPILRAQTEIVCQYCGVVTRL